MMRELLNSVLNECIAQGIRYHILVDLSGKRRVGHLLKVNNKTIWVKVMRGAKTYDIIKRKIDRDNCRIVFLDT